MFQAYVNRGYKIREIKPEMIKDIKLNSNSSFVTEYYGDARRWIVDKIEAQILNCKSKIRYYEEVLKEFKNDQM